MPRRAARRLPWLALAAAVAGALLPTDARPQSPLGRVGPAPRSPAQEHEGEGLSVFRGQAEILRYSHELATVIIGDPAVAIAAIAASDILVLTGLQPGVTNVIVLDEDGSQIDRISLRVLERGSNVVIGRGRERQLFRCDPGCSPVTEPGTAGPSLSRVPRPLEPAGTDAPSDDQVAPDD